MRRTGPAPVLAVLAATALALAAPHPVAAAKRAILVRDFGSRSGNDSVQAAENVKSVLEARGFAVDETDVVPANLAPYCCAWDLRPFTTLSDSDRARYAAFLNQGHGLLLVGENAGCCAPRNQSVQDFLRDSAGAGAVAIDPLNELLGDFSQTTNFHATTRSPLRVDFVTYDGRGAGVFNAVGRGTHLTPAAFSPGEMPSAAFDEGDMLQARPGRAVAVLDVNWLDDDHFSGENLDFTVDISHFLCPTSGGSSFAVEITSPASYQLECPDTLSLQGIVTGGTEDCVQATNPPAPPAIDAGVRVVAIDYSVNNGPFVPVTATNPPLPADTPVTFSATGIAVPLGGSNVRVRARQQGGGDTFDVISGTQLDTLPPVIDPATCQDETVDLGASCSLDYTGVPTASDQCDPVVDITSVPPLPIPFSGPGSAGVTYTATDDAGNSDTCSRTVTAVDLSPPVLTCAPDTTVECTTQGGTPATDGSIQGFLAATTAVDNCTNPPTLTDDAPPFFASGCLPGLGTDVTWTASDASNHSATCTATLSVADRTAPEITAEPDPLTLECNQIGGVAASDPQVLAWLDGFQAADLCAAAVTRTSDVPALIPVDCGQTPTTVTFTAGDDCANEATFAQTVNVVDTTPPTLTPPPPLDLECNSQGGVLATDPVFLAWFATGSDICQLAGTDRTLPPLVPSGCGSGTVSDVEFTATDGCGNTTSATQTVTVHDLTPPALAVPAPITLECDQQGGISRNDPRIAAWLASATAQDVCDGAPITDDAPALFPGGCGAGTVTTVTFRAADNCNNETLLTSTVTVIDTTAPTLSVPPPLSLECSSQGGVLRTDPQVVAWLASASGSDVCGGVTLSDDTPSLIPADCGTGRTTTVTFEARDDCGHVTRATSTITVTDTTAPDLSVPAPITIECSVPGGVPQNDSRIAAWLAQATSSDVCGAAHLTHDAPPLFPSGCGAGTTTTVTFESVDDCGNRTTDTSSVTVVDTTPPALTVPLPLSLECNSPGGVPASDPRIQAWLALATASDLCGTATISNDAPAFFPSGCGTGMATTVTFHAVDDCGNAVDAASSVIVADTTPPLLSVPVPIVFECTAPGGVPRDSPAAEAWLAQARASDVCDGATLSNDAPALFPSGCAPGQTTNVTFTARDNCDNAAQDSATVTVADTTPPELSGCGLEPWDPVLGEPRAPRPPGSATSCATSAQFAVRCGTTSDLCDTRPVTSNATIVVRYHDVVDETCVPREETVPIACDEVVELRLIPPPCPARPREPRGGTSVNSAGVRVITGEAMELRVRSQDGCGNTSATCIVDPLTTDDPTNPGQPLLCPPQIPDRPRCRVPRCGG